MNYQKWRKHHSVYERRAFKIVRDHFRQAINVNWEQLTPGTYKIAIAMNVDIEQVKEAYFQLYWQIGLLHAKRIGWEINREIRAEQKKFTLPRFTEIFRRGLRTFIDAIAPTRITSVHQNFVDHLVSEFGTRLEQGKTIPEIATDMTKYVNSPKFYRWQALRIARTETTAAANYGAIQGAEDSGIEMEKEWISAEDGRVRRLPKDEFDHRTMHGQRVAMYQEFIVPGKEGAEFLNFPGDPNGRASDIVNCRCTVGLVPKRDNQGNLIFRE